MKTANPAVRCKVEHAFRIIKCQFGYKKTVYRGLKKTRTDCTLCSLVPIYTPLQSPGENSQQPEIGAVCPLGKIEKKSRELMAFCAEIALIKRKKQQYISGHRIRAICSEVP